MQKPSALAVFILKLPWSPNGIVLDPYAGSGWVGVAAAQLGRRFLGFELEQKYVDIANDRIAAAKRGQSYRDYKMGQEVLPLEV